jgi:hypothetical protein
MFDYSKYPDYFNININAGRMGFRPIIVQEAAKEFSGSIILWLEAGCLITENPLEMIYYIKKHGVYCHLTHGTIKEGLHPNAIAPLDATEAVLSLPMRDSGVSGFDTSKEPVGALINRWVEVALNKDATCPKDSSRKNHRQDAVFSVILAQSGIMLDEYHSIAIKMRQDGLPLSEAKRRYNKSYALPVLTKFK